MTGVLVTSLLLGVSPAVAPAGTIEIRPDERLHVEAAGQGPTLALIPGLMGSAYGFRKIVGPLQDSGFRVAVVEPLGIGSSPRPSDADYSLTAQADRVDAALRELDGRPAVVVAHSVGASIALRLAYRHPERVAAIVSLDGGPAEVAGTRGFRRAMRFAPLLRLFGGKGRIRGHVRSSLVSRSADRAWVTDEVVNGYMEGPSRDLGATLRAYGRMADASEPEPLAPHLAEIRCPVRLVIGTATREGGISEAEIAQLRGSLPSFAVETVPDAGHFVFEEKPLAVVAAVARAVGSAAHVAWRRP